MAALAQATAASSAAGLAALSQTATSKTNFVQFDGLNRSFAARAVKATRAAKQVAKAQRRSVAVQVLVRAFRIVCRSLNGTKAFFILCPFRLHLWGRLPQILRPRPSSIRSSSRWECEVFFMRDLPTRCSK